MPQEIPQSGHEHDFLVARLAELDANKPEIYNFELRQKMFSAIKTWLTLDSESKVLYVGSNTDTSVADCFGKENVMNLDIDTKALEVLEQEGYHTFRGNSEDGNFGQDFNIVVFWNSGVTARAVLDAVKIGGFVIANNYHGSANTILDDPEFKLVGAVTQKEPDKVVRPEICRVWLGAVQQKIDKTGNITTFNTEESVPTGDDSVIVTNKAPDDAFVFQKQS